MHLQLHGERCLAEQSTAHSATVASAAARRAPQRRAATRRDGPVLIVDSDPAVRRMLTILTRDESFHVPLNVHFLRETIARKPEASRLRLQLIHDLLFVALLLSSYASRRQTPARRRERAGAPLRGRRR